MRFYISILLWFLCATCLAQDDEWHKQLTKIIDKGKERMEKISKATLDTTRTDDVESTWDVESPGDVALDEAYDKLEDINKAGNLGLSDHIARKYAQFPKGIEEDDDEAIRATFEMYFDPKGATIVAANRVVVPGDPKPDRSSADVAWSFYKEICQAQKLDHTNLKTVLSLRISAAGSLRRLPELWDAVKDKTKPHTYTDLKSDEATSLLGLDNGSLVTDLLTYHNVQMGGKVMDSVTLYLDESGLFNVWWTLKPKPRSKFRFAR